MTDLDERLPFGHQKDPLRGALPRLGTPREGAGPIPQAPFKRTSREAYEMAAVPAFGQAIGQCSTSARRSLHVLGLDPVKSDVGPVAGGEGAA